MRIFRTAFLSLLPLAAAYSFACAGSEVDSSTTGDGTTSGQGGEGASGNGGAGGSECVPVDETCDGADNDCDGEVDEPPCICQAGATQACYSGPPGTEGIGECLAGTQTCDAMGTFGPCTGEVVPATEECNGIDDDCNDAIDDKGEESCGVGACAVTITVCDNGQPQTCTPGMPTLESCDGIDNDCDQLTDESDPNQGSVCQTGLPGACAAGTQQCVMGALTCVADLMPVPESCNSVDDDCNGTVDDNVPGTGGVCDTGFQGPCGPGTISCQGGILDCFSNVPPSPEVCDGIDNDCEGIIDNMAPCPAPLTCSMGVCDLVCTNGTIECNNACIDPLTDEQNCGMCNNICGANLVCNNGQCQPPLYTFSGVQTNVPIASLVGWTQCYIDTYANSGTSLGVILSQCSQAKLMLGCRQTNSNTLIVVAQAPRLDVIFDTGGSANSTATHVANGVGWYFNNSWSWGFALAGDPVTQNSCDTTASSFSPGPNGNLRLCWHTGGGSINGGWRCGTNDNLNSSAAFQRIIYQAP